MTTKIPAELSSTPGIVDNSDATAITIDSSENVGVGTTSPSTFSGFKTLHFKNGSGDTIFLNESDGGVIGQILTSDSVGAVTLGARSNHDLRLSTNDTERMRIDSSGGVQIGASSIANLKFSQSSDVISITAKKDGTDAIPLTFHTQASGGTTAERMRIDSAGNALFGTTSSSIGTGVGIKLRADSSTAPYMGIVLDTNSSAHGNYMHYNLNSTYNGYRFYVFNNGGIANYQANNSNLSDERVKTNIELSGNYLEKICNIPVKLFNYKDEPEDKERSLGVIAQDVEAVAPELVNNEGFGNTPKDGVPLKTVYTTDMMYALMKAIQEQQDIIDDLKSRIETLEG